MHISFDASRIATRMFDVTTSLSKGGDVAKVAVDETARLDSPVHAFGQLFGVRVPGPNHLKLPTNDFDIAAPKGTKLHDAISSFEALGAEHGVDGVRVPSAGFDAGGIQRQPGGISVTGGDYNGIGRSNAAELTAAARAVLAAAGVG